MFNTVLEDLISLVQKQGTKFIVVTGGVCSSIGKGVLISSIGTLLKNTGASISIMKMDPYLNVDPGTISPLVHGEVFVTHDGAETDLDLGHYERMIGVKLTKESSISSGQIFQEVLRKEREGEFLGKDIQLVPHVVDAIKMRALSLASKTKPDFLLIEIGGTIGDMEGEIFLEAIRQLRIEFGYKNFMHAHLSLVPYLEWANEIKTKPTQHSVMLLKKAGIIPDSLFLRTEKKIGSKTLKKLSMLSGIDEGFIFQVPTYKPIYKLFTDLRDQKLHEKIQKLFGFSKIKDTDIADWEGLIDTVSKNKRKVKIGLIAKYVGSNDPYMSVIHAIRSASWACDCDAEIITIDADKLTNDDEINIGKLKKVDGIVIPGGFDGRGIEWKIKAIKFARENDIPCLGLCLGLQAMLIEFTRSFLGLFDAASSEYDKTTKNPVIVLLEEQKDIKNRGGSMRLGAYLCKILPGTKAHEAYGKEEIYERHRHRYEFNNKYRSKLEKAGVVFSGIYEKKNLVEIAELKGHKFMLGTQAHPEFTSSPLKPNPLFKSFMNAVIEKEELI